MFLYFSLLLHKHGKIHSFWLQYTKYTCEKYAIAVQTIDFGATSFLVCIYRSQIYGKIQVLNKNRILKNNKRCKKKRINKAMTLINKNTLLEGKFTGCITLKSDFQLAEKVALFASIKTLQKWWKMLFVSSWKHFLSQDL